MIGIYQDNFIDFLRENLGDKIKISSKNIIVPCPWCEYGKQKPHYHLYISLEAPIFHCFYAGCEVGGILSKFLKKIQGYDISDTFIDKDKIKEVKQDFSKYEEKERRVIIPELEERKFPYKAFYLKKRLKFSNINLLTVKGLIFDIDKFIEVNDIAVEPSLFRVKDYLHSNFVGFLTEHSSLVMLRNVDERSSFPFFKLRIHENPFIDYYQLSGRNQQSNKIVLSEGIFDIFSEHIFDNLNMKNDVRLYASVLSSKFSSLIKSVVFYEQIFQPEVIILSDNKVSLNYYRKLKEVVRHLISKLDVYFNKTGKDFNNTPVNPLRFVIE